MKKVRINGEHGYPIKVHGLDEDSGGSTELYKVAIEFDDSVGSYVIDKTPAQIMEAVESGLVPVGVFTDTDGMRSCWLFSGGDVGDGRVFVAFQNAQDIMIVFYPDEDTGEIVCETKYMTMVPRPDISADSGKVLTVGQDGPEWQTPPGQ